MAIELEKMLALGKLRNLKQVIAFNRLMVRGDEFENRMKMLDLLLVRFIFLCLDLRPTL